MAMTPKKTVTLASVSPMNSDNAFTPAAAANDIQENVRKATEKGLEETRAAYARVKTAAEGATQSIEASYSTATKGIVEINTKAIEALRANTDATFDFFKSLMGVKSISEAITLQSEHARKQFDAVTFQGKEISSLAQKIASDAVAPIQASLGKTFNVAR